MSDLSTQSTLGVAMPHGAPDENTRSVRIAEEVSPTRPPLSICFVAPYVYPVLADAKDIPVVGGAEVQQVLLATEMARRGHRVSVVSLDFGQSDVEYHRGVKCLKSHRGGSGIRGLRFIHPAATGLWAALDRANADIYYQRSSALNTGVVALFAKLRRRGMIFASAAATDFATDLPRLQLPHQKLMYRFGLRHAGAIVVQSDRQALDCARMCGRIATVVNSVCSEVSSSAEHGGPILWVGNTRPHKRPDLFLDLALALPTYQFKLIGASPDDPEYFERLMKRAAGIRNLEMIGHVPYSEVGKYFDDASLIVNTSPAEGFPNTFLEAWSRGIPSVAMFDIGARLDGQDVAVAVDELSSLVRSVDGLKREPDGWRRMGERCIEYVRRNNSVRDAVDRYETIVTEMIESPNRSRSPLVRTDGNTV